MKKIAFGIMSQEKIRERMLAIAKGEPLKVTQERLGHASPATTLAMYGHATPEMHGEAADRRGGLLGTRDFTPKPGRRHRRSG